MCSSVDLLLFLKGFYFLTSLFPFQPRKDPLPFV